LKRPINHNLKKKSGDSLLNGGSSSSILTGKTLLLRVPKIKSSRSGGSSSEKIKLFFIY
jgi:hypothetical protein